MPLRHIMSIQPLLRLMAAQPHLLVDHLEAYAALVEEELGTATSTLKRRWLLNAISLGLLSVGVVFGGVALMLWAVVPIPSNGMSWVLLVVPALPVAAALVCLASRGHVTPAFGDLRQQIAADFQMLRDGT